MVTGDTVNLDSRVKLIDFGVWPSGYAANAAAAAPVPFVSICRAKTGRAG